MLEFMAIGKPSFDAMRDRTYRFNPSARFLVAGIDTAKEALARATA